MYNVCEANVQRYLRVCVQLSIVHVETVSDELHLLANRFKSEKLPSDWKLTDETTEPFLQKTIFASL